MSTPRGPRPNPADQPYEEPVWGRQPPGGWGQKPPPPGPSRQSPGPPAQLGEPPAWTLGYPPLPEPTLPTTSALPRVVAGAAVVALGVGAVLGFVTPGFLVTRVFDPAAVRSGVQSVLTRDYGIQGVTAVACAQDVAVTAGVTFECTATIDGDPVRVPIRVTSNDGGYQVGRPR